MAKWQHFPDGEFAEKYEIYKEFTSSMGIVFLKFKDTLGL